jgi:hypothetical protein
MKILKRIILILTAFIALLLGISIFLPSKWEVSRSIIIQAPPERIYPLVANFQNGWKEWSSFDYEDPNIVYSYSGPAEGLGAKRAWLSKKMGNGYQIITGAHLNQKVEFELYVTSTNFYLKGYFELIPEGTGTKVIWKDYGDAGNNPMFRYMGFAMDSMMGKTFETSLQKLKIQAEKK